MTQKYTKWEWEYYIKGYVQLLNSKYLKSNRSMLLSREKEEEDSRSKNWIIRTDLWYPKSWSSKQTKS